MNLHLCEDKINVVDTELSTEQLIKEIIQTNEVSDPFHILDIDGLVYKACTWNKKFPKVIPYYTVKCNDNSFVLQTLAAMNTNFSCTSKSDAEKVLNLGVEPYRIIISNPAKMAHHIKYALSQGVDLLTFDNALELHKIKHLYPSCRLLLQICYDHTETPLGMKIGCRLFVEARELLSLAFDLGLSVVGVSFHVGSDCKEPAAFGKAIFYSKIVFDMAQDVGFLNMRVLDIGGGFPGNNDTLFDQIVGEVNNAVNEWFPSEDMRILAEPGTFFTASLSVLTTKILSLNVEEQDDKGVKNVKYIINDGVHGSFYKILKGHSVDKFMPVNSYPTDQIFESSIWGSTGDEFDELIGSVKLPLMNTGDWFSIYNMGAYTKPIANFSDGFTFPKIFAVAGENTRSFLKDLLPVTKDHFTTVPIIGTVKEPNTEKADTPNNNNSTRQNQCVLY